MKINSIARLTILAFAAVPAVAAAQVQVSHYSGRGFIQSTYWEAPGGSAFFQITEEASRNGRGPIETLVQGNALIVGQGTMVTYVPSWGAFSGSVVPSNQALRIPGTAVGSFSATRIEYSFFPFFHEVSRTEGTIIANSTLSNPTLIQNTRQPWHNHMSLPGIGLLFAINSSYHGRIGFNPTGSGGMKFVSSGGATEVIVPEGTATSSASWMGHFVSAETEIIRN